MLASRSGDGHSKAMTEKKELMRVEEGSELEFFLSDSE